ncbi:hypothetical protein F0562_008049 [Nyssa sinensis]|uniref:Uncharacterized protein n=1 Tax=Nyssa sinensis TaxID=561372 RepID=A0A5J5A8K7_9ASTE|nr:hypothetical protein F0562_008049 [Nyssa sinensis]
MTAGEEANVELVELKRVVEELRKSDKETGSKVEVLEKERNLLLKRMDTEVERRKKCESRIVELEKKNEVLEARESTQNGERIKVEKEARAIVDKKDTEIRQLKKWIQELDSVVREKDLETERLKKERDEMEIVKNEWEAHLKKSERRVKETEHKMNQLHKELEASRDMISVLKENAVEAVNGETVVMDRTSIEDGEKRVNGFEAAVASGGSINWSNCCGGCRVLPSLWKAKVIE